MKNRWRDEGGLWIDKEMKEREREMKRVYEYMNN